MASNFRGYLKTEGEYKEALKNKKIVIDFTAQWCGPCKRIGPVFQKLAEEFSEILFFKVDVDDNADTSEAEEIQAMPTFKFYHNGVANKEATLRGASEEELKKRLEALASS